MPLNIFSLVPSIVNVPFKSLLSLMEPGYLWGEEGIKSRRLGFALFLLSKLQSDIDALLHIWSDNGENFGSQLLGTEQSPYANATMGLNDLIRPFSISNRCQKKENWLNHWDIVDVVTRYVLMILKHLSVKIH